MDERPGIIFHQVLRAHHNACTAALARQGLRDIGSPRLLVELAQYPDGPGPAPTQKELADALHSAPATIAASLKVLERQGYVARRIDEKDSRRNRVAITRKGRDTPEEREQVYRFHRRMLDNLYQIGGGRDDGCCPPPPPKPLERKCDPC